LTTGVCGIRPAHGILKLERMPLLERREQRGGNGKTDLVLSTGDGQKNTLRQSAMGCQFIL
jgi:hypothetical protein